MSIEQIVKPKIKHISHICKTCGKVFTTKQSRQNAKYCNRKCVPKFSGWTISAIAKQHRSEGLKRAFAEGRKSNKGEKNPRWGQHCSEETKRKIGAVHKGKIGFPGSLNPMYGKKLSDEAIEKRSEKMRGRHYHTEEHKKQMSEKLKQHNPMDTPEARKKRSESLKGLLIGDKNPNWRGGSSFEPYCIKFNKEFKERVRLFFGNVCGNCKLPEPKNKLNIHHVNYDKMTCCNDTKPQFIPLCNHCHAITNGKREHWEEKFTTIINNEYGGKCYFSKEDMELKSQQKL